MRQGPKTSRLLYNEGNHLAPGLLMNVSYAEPKDPRLSDADWQTLGRLAERHGTSTRVLQTYQIMAGAKAVIDDRPGSTQI